MSDDQIRVDFEREYRKHSGLKPDALDALLLRRLNGDYAIRETYYAFHFWRRAHARYAGGGEADGLLEYVLQDDIHNRLTPRIVDIAYTAFMLAKEPNSEDGGPSDWFNDTKPSVMKSIDKLRGELLPYCAPAQPKMPDALNYNDMRPCDYNAGLTTGWNNCRQAMIASQEN